MKFKTQKLVVAMALITASLPMSSVAQQSKERDAVLLINMQYDGDRWFAKGESVLPCAGPSKPDSRSSMRSMIRLTDKSGKTVTQRYITNPRLILVEDPKERPELLKEMSFSLRVPVKNASEDTLSRISTFEFSEKGEEVSVKLDLQGMVERFLSNPPKSASCILKAPDASKLPKIDVKPDESISPELAKKLMQENPVMVMSMGVRLGVEPSFVQAWVSENSAVLKEMDVSEGQVRELLKEYQAFYSKNSK